MKAERLEADILVIGGGAAGCSAALQARKAGAKVLMVVKGRMGRSGATPLASMLSYPPRTAIPTKVLKWLRAPYSALSDYIHVPVPKSIRMLLDKSFRGQFGLIDQDYMIRLGLYLSADFIPSIEDRGLFIQRHEDGTPVLPKAVGGAYNFYKHGMTGYQFGEARRKEVLGNDIEVIEEASAISLMTDERGHVTGAIAFDYQYGRLLAIAAPAIILATGHTNWLSTRATGTREMAANGLAMALRAGAELQNMEIQWFHASDTVSPKCWMRLHHYPNPISDSDKRIVMRNSQGEIYMRLDDYNIMSPYTIQMKELYHQVKAGKADWDKGSFADFSPIDEETLRETQYNWEFYAKLGKNMATDPMECGITWHMSGGGVRANLDTMETRVPGLFIAGPVGGHILGGLGPSTYDGVVAAAGAMRHLRQAEKPAMNEAEVSRAADRLSGLLKRASLRSNDDVSPIGVKTRIREIAWNNMMYVKTEAGLRKALAELAAVRRELLPKMRIRDGSRRYNFDLVDALDVEDMLDVLEVTAEAALIRKESRGPHFREDHPVTDNDNWLKYVVLSRQNGQTRSRLEPVREKYISMPRGQSDYFSNPYG